MKTKVVTKKEVILCDCCQKETPEYALHRCRFCGREFCYYTDRDGDPMRSQSCGFFIKNILASLEAGQSERTGICNDCYVVYQGLNVPQAAAALLRKLLLDTRIECIKRSKNSAVDVCEQKPITVEEV